MIMEMRFLLISLIALNAIVEASGIFYEEISETTGNTIIEKSLQRTPIINKALHQCSTKENCNYVIKNLTSGRFTLYNNEYELPRKTTGLRLWRKVYHGPLTDCRDAYKRGNKQDGIFTIKVPSIGLSQVCCDITIAPKGWIVFQRRVDATVGFFRSWKDYKDGFGDLSGNFWLGLETLHQLVAPGARASLRVDLKHNLKPNEMKYAEYSLFEISNESDGYRLNIGGYSGNAGDSLSHQDGMKFSTKDKDQDTSDVNCAAIVSNAIWNSDCFRASLTGLYPTGISTNVIYMSWYSMANEYGGIIFSEMKIRK